MQGCLGGLPIFADTVRTIDPSHDGVKDYAPEEQLALMLAIPRETGKPLFVGEFGPNLKEKRSKRCDGSSSFCWI